MVDPPQPAVHGARRRALWLVAALVVTAYAGLLRYEAVISNYGWMGQPRWSEALAHYALPLAAHLRPASVVWGPVPEPYVGGDPINYLQYSRDMTHFYQGHVREPMFLAWTRLWLWASGDRDIALSFSSASAGTLAVFATFLLGAAAFSPPVGLIAALALAIEFEAIGWSKDGWRDDMFMLFVALTGWAFVRLRQHPSWRRAVAAGLVVAAACLTRITALSFVIPGLIWLLIDTGNVDRRVMIERVAAVLSVAVVLIAPYLVNCARVSGDPFLSINYHTQYYQSAEGLPVDESLGVAGYLGHKVTERPVYAFDTAMRGIFLVPFLNKWTGFGLWSSRLGPALEWSAVAGLLLAAWCATGRLLLVMLVTSLVPYALTWNVGGGSEWRFTQHVYPFYLVLSASALAFAARWIVERLSRRDVSGLAMSRSTALRTAAIVLTLAAAWSVFRALPFLVVREALAAGDAVTITAGSRDDLFFEGDWSEPIGMPGGNVTIRVAQANRVRINVPTPAAVDYWLTLRLDPPETTDHARTPRLRVVVNGRHLADFDLTRDPDRMGSYRLLIPRDLVTGISGVELEAGDTVPAADAGPPFASLPPSTPVAFRLWYARLEPRPSPPHSGT
jgi:hypothetical protein